MLRKRWHWLVFAAVAAACAGFAVVYFPRALPIVAIDLRMEREAALQAAADVAARYELGPAGYRQAATFTQDDPEVQTYIELEAGGRDAFLDLREAGIFEPYIWRVRHFRAGEATESLLRFTPAGEPYGYVLRLPEDEPGASLSAAAARQLVEASAAAQGVDLSAYQPLEASQVVRPGGRTDHTFVYQRSGVAVGDATVRLRLGVAGDRIAELTHFVHVPEAFSRRYQEMRAANQTVALLANVFFLVVFFIGGCGIGTFLLLRSGWLVWRPPLVWAAGIALLLALATLNGMPLQWMGYDTATSEGSFIAMQLGMAAAILLFGTPLLALIFMAAESLTRRAFPHQLQQWRLWSPGVANTDPVLGRTLGGYLWVPVNLAFVVAFYYLGSRYFGWWTPSEALVNPDVVATRFPWLTAVALSAMSGFWEESLFRAVPLAGAALIGQRYGHRTLWIGGALVLQAVVFAAAHADYPQQPAYARVVELVIPAMAWGLIYLRWGLLPVALTHFAFNLSLFSLPLLTASAPGLWPSKVMVVAAGLTPLGIVLFARWRHGSMAEAPADALNAAWQPDTAPAEEVQPAAVVEPVHAAPLLATPRQLRYAVPAAALLGLVLWAMYAPRVSDQPRLELSRDAAVEIARQELPRQRDFTPSPEWREIPTVHAEFVEGGRFVWREGGRAVFAELRDELLLAPHWHVRYARFSGPVEERAEEYDVIVTHAGTVQRIEQSLPESRPGATLEEADARTIAQQHLVERFGRDPGAMREVAATATTRPARRDWEFVYADPDFPMDRGEARVRIVVAGDAVIDAHRFVHVPEEWSRAQRSGRMPSMVAAMMSGAFFFLIFGAAVVLGIIRWSRARQWPLRLVLSVFAGMLLLLAASAANNLPAITAEFMTAQPWETQLFAVAAVFGIMLLIGAAGVAIAAGLLYSWGGQDPWPPTLPSRRGAYMIGAAAGLLLAGVSATAARFGPQAVPVSASYGGADAYIPSVAAALGPVASFISTTLMLLIVLAGVQRYTAGWRQRRVEAAVSLVLLGTVLLAARIPDLQWSGLLPALAGGLALFAAFLLVQRLHIAVVPPAIAVPVVLGQVTQIVLRPYPGAAAGAAIAIVLVLALAAVWVGLLLRPVPQPAGETTVAGAVHAGG
jgi:hypothetical protein